MRAIGDPPVIDGSPTAGTATGSPSRRPTANRVASLTGLRAVAALLVVGTHAAFGTGALNYGYLGSIYARLEVGVPVFFVLSGFLLFRPWVLAAQSDSAPPSVRRYAWRRVRRILPAYLITVLIAYAIYQFRYAGPNPGHNWLGLLAHLTLTQMWSLAVEAAFYAMLPLLAGLLLTVLCRRRWRPGLLLAGLGALGALTPLWLGVQHGTDWLPIAAGMWLPAHLLQFVGGMALAVLQATGARARAIITLPLALIAFLVVASPVAGNILVPQVEPWQPAVKAVLYAVVAVCLLAPLVLGTGSLYARLLSTRPMVWLGEISYEIFLLHMIVMEIAMASVLRWPVFTGSMPGLFAVTVAMTVPLAWLLHRWTRVRPTERERKPIVG